jgi:NAD(P)H-nitrite reductase large subunit
VNLNNVFTFRTVNDVLNIKEAAKSAKNIVVVGSSFIGLESAATLKAELKDAANITVVG